MSWRLIATIWTAAIVVGIAASLFYMFEHGLCDTTTCGANWLQPLLLILGGGALLGTFVVYAIGRRKHNR
jgi:hypothetical protein